MTARRATMTARFLGWCGAILVMAYPANVLGQDPADEFSEAGAVFAGYEGSWTVTVHQPEAGEMVAKGSGTAEARTRIGGRFLEIEAALEDAPLSEVLYVLGFDTRHGTYNIVAFDNTGTYWVTAAEDSTAGPPHIVMYGTDDDPHMTSMGFEKAFAFVWHLGSMDRFTIQTRWIDTRTPARDEHVFLTLEFTRN